MAPHGTRPIGSLGRLVDKAMDGDPRLLRELLGEIHKKETQAELDASRKPLAEADREMLEALYIPLRRDAAARE